MNCLKQSLTAIIVRAQDDARFAIADPICTFVFALLVLLTTRSLLRDISDTLMERVPRGLDADAMQARLQEVTHPSSFSVIPWSHRPYSISAVLIPECLTECEL